jgi:hypothetical protein
MKTKHKKEAKGFAIQVEVLIIFLVAFGILGYIAYCAIYESQPELIWQ